MAHKESGVSAEAGIPFLKDFLNILQGIKICRYMGRYCAKKYDNNE